MKARKSKEQIEKDAEDYLRYQKEYNETGNQNILWKEMYPILLDMIESGLKKRSNGRYIDDIEGKIEDGAIRIINRYIQDPKKNYEYPLSAVYYVCIRLVYGDHYDRVHISLDDPLPGLENKTLKDTLYSDDEFIAEYSEDYVG